MVNEYLFPRNWEEASKLATQENSIVLSGGTEAFKQSNSSQKDHIVIDLSQINGVAQVSASDGWMEIPTCMTLTALSKTDGLEKLLPSIFEAIKFIGSPQVRNQGTAVGNVMAGRAVSAIRLSAAAIGGKLKVQGSEGERIIELGSLQKIKGCLKRGEIVSSLLLPLKESSKTASYQASIPRKSFAYPSVNVAVSLELSDGTIDKATIVAGPVLPEKVKKKLQPCVTCGGSCRICEMIHLEELEVALAGTEVSIETASAICEDFVWNSVPMRDSIINGTSEYRQHLLSVLTVRAVTQSISRLRRYDSKGEYNYGG